MNRRSFLGASLAGGAAIGSAAAAGLGGRKRVSANDKVSVAMMGVRGRGPVLTRYFGEMPDVDLSYICDVDQNVVGPAFKIAEETQGKRPKMEEDIRRVLDDKSVDAVVIATPIHWHSPGTILCCEAGKDVYVEKPVSHNVREGRLMVKAANKYDRIVQVGTQSRSRPNTHRFIEYVHSGKIGKVLMAKVWNTQLRRNIGHKEDEPVPAGINYDLWNGPIPVLPFNRNHYSGTVNWHWHYGCGDLGNDGVHWIDVARWVMKAGLPQRVRGAGRKLYFDDDQQTPDTQTVVFDYEDTVIQYEMRLWNSYKMNDGQNGVEVYGTEGKAVAGYFDGHRSYGFRIYDSKNRLVRQELSEGKRGREHYVNFIDCIRTRETPNCDAEEGHLSTSLCHLGNIAARTRGSFSFDPATETITDDPEANALLTREYRDHWSTRLVT